MGKKVGIPRALLYYEFFPMWKAFFEELGAEIIVSDATIKKILDDGVKNSVDEACLPVKLFHGHIMNLKDRVDYLFIPRLTSIARGEYICPKFGGLPDMVRHTLKELPPVIDTEINVRKEKDSLWLAYREIGSYFTRNQGLVRRAYKKAVKAYENFKKTSLCGGLINELPEFQFAAKSVKTGTSGKTGNSNSGLPDESNKKTNIVLLGHVYNIYDNFINMDLIKKLKENNVNIITPEMIPEECINRRASELPKKLFWTFGRRILGSACTMAEADNIDGIIYIMSFGCGVDAFIGDLAERKIRKSGNIPFIVLTLDEHTGEAGLNTRLEAFLDMIYWRKRNEGNLPSHG